MHYAVAHLILKLNPQYAITIIQAYVPTSFMHMGDTKAPYGARVFVTKIGLKTNKSFWNLDRKAEMLIMKSYWVSMCPNEKT